MKQKTQSSQKYSGTLSSRPKKRGRKKAAALDPEVLPAAAEEREEGQFSSDEGEEAEGGEVGEGEEPSEAEIQSSVPASIPVSEPEPGAVSQSDPLRRYMEEIRKYPLLEPHEEFALTMKLKNDGDLSAAKALVSANLRLVVKIAFEYRTFYSNLLDLIQEGNVGLMKAVSKFDPTKGARLGYYASWWIRSYILKYLLDNFRLVRIGTTQAQKKLFYHLIREKERLEAQGLLAGPKLLAERLNVREKDVVEMEQRLSGQGAEMSLDVPVNQQDGESTLHKDLLADHQEGASEALEREQLLKILRMNLPKFQETLSEKEESILRDRLLSEDPKTLQEMADLYGLTRERVRQIEAKLIEKLRAFLSLEH